MSVNPELAGRVLPPRGPYLVGREKVREFSRAVFATDPLSLEPGAARAAGYADVVAAPTFAIVIQQSCLDALLAEPDTGIDLARVLHGEQRFHYARPVVAGDLLTARLTVTTVRALAGNTMLTAETRIDDERGAEVATATSVLVVQAGDDAGEAAR
ncbi:MAG TPA: MaoC family dehydratase N-terminal domain-containing protein [Microbacteriaceae bacterium]|nr:MaoC family dehydratase N-terminal domain-containing protein [Microbacteriaceae bacterium]